MEALEAANPLWEECSATSKQEYSVAYLKQDMDSQLKPWRGNVLRWGLVIVIMIFNSNPEILHTR